MNKNLLLVDMQKDLCDVFGKYYVDKSEPIIQNFSSVFKTYIKAHKPTQLPSLLVALKTREHYHLYHQSFWKNAKHERPPIGTIITLKDVVDGKWLPLDVTCDEDVREFLQNIIEEQYPPLMITPTHCVLGSTGHSLNSDIDSAVSEWESAMGDSSIKLLHGLRPLELYRQNPESVISCSNIDEVDPILNGSYIVDAIVNADLTGIAGMSLTTGVAETMLDLESLEMDPTKLAMISDGCPELPNSKEDSKAIKEHLTDIGIKTMTLIEFLNVA